MKRILTALGATMLVGVGSLAVPAFATEDGPQKVFVCKYVGTPGVDERLQPSPNNPIEVSVNAIPIYNSSDPAFDTAEELVGKEFADGQIRSLVIAVSEVRGGGQGDEPTIPTCPAPEGPPEEPEEPKVVTAVAPTFTDPCGPDNEVLTLPVTEGVTYSQETVANVITVTAAANAGFVLAAPASFTFTVNDAACPTEDDDEVLGETANDNDGNSNGGNNNNAGNNNAGNNNAGNNEGGGTPEVLGEQAFANNGPTAGAQQSAPVSSVPTVINAGTAGAAPASPLAPAAIALFGALMGLIALGMRGGLARVSGGKA